MDGASDGPIPFIDQPYLHLIADFETPVDLMVFSIGVAVDEFPMHVGRCCHAVDIHHAVFPLDAVMGFRGRFVMHRVMFGGFT
jgi:hypothetical protein